MQRSSTPWSHKYHMHLTVVDSKLRYQKKNKEKANEYHSVPLLRLNERFEAPHWNLLDTNSHLLWVFIDGFREFYETKHHSPSVFYEQALELV